jgi:hypothetical protein
MHPTKMNIICTFKSKSSADEEASDSLVELSEVISNFTKLAEEECCAIFSKALNIEKSSVRTSAVYDSVENFKDGRKMITKEFSHYESVQSVNVSTDINVPILVSLLGKVLDNPYLVSYNYSFSVSDEERAELKSIAIGKAYNMGEELCKYLQNLQGADYYTISEMCISDERVGVEKCATGANFNNAFSLKDMLLVEDCIDVKDVCVSSVIDFCVDFNNW